METRTCRVDGCGRAVSKLGRMCDVCMDAQPGKKHPCVDCGRMINKRVKRCDKHWMEAKGGVTHRKRPRISAKLRAEVLERDDFTCQNPGCGFNPERHGLRKDQFLVLGHIQSHAAGGETSAANLRVLCAECNREEWFLNSGGLA